MSISRITDAEVEGATNSPSKIHIAEYKTYDYSVFTVYYHNRCWKRLRPIKGEGAALWFKQNANHNYSSVSERRVKWLDNIWRHSDYHPRIYRYPRKDREGARILDNLMIAFASGQLDVVEQQLERFRTHIGISTFRVEVLQVGLFWATLPRFNPSACEKSKWLIDSFLAERSIQLIFGERGSFKSTLLLFAAKAVASREEFLGMRTHLRRVLYLDFENPATIIKSRNDDLELNLPHNPNLVIWDRFGKHPLPRPDDPRLEAFVRHCVEETGHGPWIIFDSWSSLLRPGEGGENTGQIAPIYAEFRKLADLGATISVMDHSRKYAADIIYGGQDKEAKVDTIHNLQTFENKIRPENKIVRVESWLKRFAPKGVGVFAFEVQSKKDKNGDWHIIDLRSVKDPLEEERREKRELLRDLIRGNPELGREGIARLAAKKGVGRDQAIDLLKNGIGKYWDFEKTAHGKGIYKIL